MFDPKLVPPQRAAEFLEKLLHELTITGRAIWSDTTVREDEIIARLKSLNEMLHLFGPVMRRVRECHELAELVGIESEIKIVLDGIEHWGSQAAGLTPYLLTAVKRTVVGMKLK